MKQIKILLCVLCMLSFQQAFCDAAWPNEPVGSILINDCPFTTASGSGWVSDGPTVTTSATAPFSPSGVLQFTYPNGMQGGGSPGQAWYLLPQLPSEVYVGFWWKANAEWQGHPAGVNKIIYVCSNEGSGGAPFGITMDGIPGGPYHLKAFYQYNNPAVDNSHITGIPGSTAGFVVYGGTQIVPGTWYRIEFYLKNSTTTSSKNGIFRWWVTPQGGQPVLDGDIRTMNTATFQYNSVNLTPVWGGVGGNKTQTDYYWFDHIRISQPNNAILPPLPLTITSSLAPGRTGTPYSATLQAVNGKAPYSWLLDSAALPTGLTLSKNGVISGSPTMPGRSTFKIRVTDSNQPALTATRTYTVVVSGISGIGREILPRSSGAGNGKVVFNLHGQRQVFPLQENSAKGISRFIVVEEWSHGRACKKVLLTK